MVQKKQGWFHAASAFILPASHHMTLLDESCDQHVDFSPIYSMYILYIYTYIYISESSTKQPAEQALKLPEQRQTKMTQMGGWRPSTLGKSAKKKQTSSLPHTIMILLTELLTGK